MASQPEFPRKMGFWEYLDRRSERRASRDPMFRFDTKTLIGFGFLLGYYVLVWQIMSSPDIPEKSIGLVRDAMLTLGPPVGVIVGAIFRSDMRDEQQTLNTGRAFEAVKAAARASGTQPDAMLQPGETAQAAPSNGQQS